MDGNSLETRNLHAASAVNSHTCISLQWTGEGEEAETDFVRQIWGGASSQFRREKKTGLGKKIKLRDALLPFFSWERTRMRECKSTPLFLLSCA